MAKQSADFVRLIAILLGTGIFISSTLGQATQTDTGPAAATKNNTSNSAKTNLKPTSPEAVKTPENAVINGTKNTGLDSAAKKTTPSAVSNLPDSSVKKDPAIASVIPDSSVKKDATIASIAPDSSLKKDPAIASVVSDSSVSKDPAITSVKLDSTVRKDSTVTSVRLDSSARKDTAITSATPGKDTITAIQTATPGVTAAVDSSKLQKNPAPTVQTDTANNKKNSRTSKKTGMGLVLEVGSAGPQFGLIGSLHQFVHCKIPINMRALFSYIAYTRGMEQTVSDQKLDIDVDAMESSVDLFLDFHPFKNWFRLSMGAFFSFSETKVKLQSKEGKTIGLITITPEEMGSLEFTFNRHPVEPYLGIGVGNTLGRRVTFQMDLGAAYTGPLEVKGKGTGMIGPSEINAQNLQNVFEAHNELFWWPVLSIGIGVKLF